MVRFKELTGNRYGMLIVVEKVENEKSHARWLCKCDCGKEKVIRGSHLTHGDTSSCGCMRNKVLDHTTHGLSHTNIYNRYHSMKKRCYVKSNASYKHYGARGISVCDEWNNCFENFYNWAIAYGYQKDLTLDRIDVNGNYEPSNCRWVTTKVNANNKRNNVAVTINGVTKNLYEWEKTTGIRYQTIQNRLKKGLKGEDLLKPTK